MTESQHEEVFNMVRKLLWTNTGVLLPEHRYLLEADLHELGAGSPASRQMWVSSMESTIAAAKHVRSGRPIEGRLGAFEGGK